MIILPPPAVTVIAMIFPILLSCSANQPEKAEIQDKKNKFSNVVKIVGSRIYYKDIRVFFSTDKEEVNAVYNTIRSNYPLYQRAFDKGFDIDFYNNVVRTQKKNYEIIATRSMKGQVFYFSKCNNIITNKGKILDYEAFPEQIIVLKKTI